MIKDKIEKLNKLHTIIKELEKDINNDGNFNISNAIVYNLKLKEISKNLNEIKNNTLNKHEYKSLNVYNNFNKIKNKLANIITGLIATNFFMIALVIFIYLLTHNLYLFFIFFLTLPIITCCISIPKQYNNYFQIGKEVNKNLNIFKELNDQVIISLTNTYENLYNKVTDIYLKDKIEGSFLVHDALNYMSNYLIINEENTNNNNNIKDISKQILQTELNSNDIDISKLLKSLKNEHQDLEDITKEYKKIRKKRWGENNE